MKVKTPNSDYLPCGYVDLATGVEPSEIIKYATDMELQAMMSDCVEFSSVSGIVGSYYVAIMLSVEVEIAKREGAIQ